MSVTYRPQFLLKDGHLAEEQRCYDFQFTMITIMDIMVLTTVWKVTFPKITRGLLQRYSTKRL